MNYNLTLQGITKYFKDKKIIDNLSYKFKTGCYTLDGRNGIGKSTLLALIAGSIPPDSGIINLNGMDYKRHAIEAKKLLSYVPDGMMAYPFLTGKEWLTFICKIKKSKISLEVESLIHDFKLEQSLSVTFDKMSLGSQKKFMLVSAAIGNPLLYLLDEPFNGLDSSSRQVFVDYLLNVKPESIIIITDHDSNHSIRLNPLRLKLTEQPITEFRK